MVFIGLTLSWFSQCILWYLINLVKVEVGLVYLICIALIFMNLNKHLSPRLEFLYLKQFGLSDPYHL